MAVTASLLGLPALSWPKQMIPGPRRVEPQLRNPGKRDSGLGQVKSDEVPTAIHTVNCGKTCHVERRPGSLPVSWGWRLCWPSGSEGVLDKPIFQLLKLIN